MKLIPDAAEAILLGFQHYIVMLGTTVAIPTYLAPQMGGGNVSLVSLIPNAHFQMFSVSDSFDYVLVTGRESEDDPDCTLCGGNQHAVSNFVWNKITSCYWSIIYLCSFHHFYYHG